MANVNELSNSLVRSQASLL